MAQGQQSLLEGKSHRASEGHHSWAHGGWWPPPSWPHRGFWRLPSNYTPGRQAQHFLTDADPGGVPLAAHTAAYVPADRKARLPTLRKEITFSPNQHFLCNNLHI